MKDCIEITDKYYMPVFNRYPLVLDHGQGCYVYDADGRKYLDFLAGIAVNILGHAHPKLVEAISQQAGKLIHCSNLYYTSVQARLIERLAKSSGMDRVFLANSGAEGNEGAIKLARKYAKKISPDKVEIITATHSFHGRTLATLMATAQPKYQQGFEPLPQGFSYVPYNDIQALADKISTKTCAVMLEPIQGEGGIHVPDEQYLAAVRELCDRNGALLIFDEIQCGMARTGQMFGYQLFNVKPDIVTLAKGLGGGIPIGAFLAVEQVAAAFSPGDHGSTFGGNPLACAAANAVFDVIEQENLLAHVQEVSSYFMTKLELMQTKYPKLIQEVRGKGLMVGIELTVPGKDIVTGCLERGLIINCTANTVLRLVPPLIVEKQQIDEMLTVLDSVLESI